MVDISDVIDDVSYVGKDLVFVSYDDCFFFCCYFWVVCLKFVGVFFVMNVGFRGGG